MNPSAHRRYLQYLERFVYFGRGGMERLSAVEFERLDAEFQRLCALQERTDAERHDLARLKSALLRD